MANDSPNLIFYSPEGNGIRILSLDAGDSRCLSQLVILDELMTRLKHDLKREIRPCEYFHSITGVGAGGVLAILLGVLGFSIPKAIESFGQICEQVFPSESCTDAARSIKLVEAFKRITNGLIIPETTRLRGDLSMSAGCHVSIGYSSSGINGFRVFRNYESRQSSYNPTIIEAVRVAWATPGLFSPIRVGISIQEELVSAVNGFSNPTLEAVREAELVFGKDRTVSTVLSLGVGRRLSIPSSEGAAIQIAQETELTAENFQRRFGMLGIYFRFSVDQILEKQGADLETHFASVTAYTREYLAGDTVNRSLDSYLKTSGHTSTTSLDRFCRTRIGGSKSSQGLPPLSAFFTLRVEPMNEIVTALQKIPSDGPAMALVTGIGGAGKTQIALKYAYDHDDEYDHILFIDASSAESLEKTLISRIKSIDRQLSPDDVEEALELLANPEGKLTRNWFVIMDNADNTSLDLMDYIPSCDHGHLLVTSRNSALGDLYPEGHIALDVMSREEAIETLLSTALGPKESSEAERPRLGRPKPSPRTKEDYDCAAKIVEELGYLPLAVIQAACYIKKQKCLYEYPSLLKNSRSKVLRWPASVQRDKLKYAHSTYAAFDTTLGALSSRALRFLGIISFFHFSDIPKALVAVAATYEFDYQPVDLHDKPPDYQNILNLLREVFCPNGHWDPMELDGLLEELQNYSLVTLVRASTDLTLRFHPLLHGWARDRLSDSDRDLFQAASIRLLACGTNEDDEHLQTYLSPHVELLSLTSKEIHLNERGALVRVLRWNRREDKVLNVWRAIHAEVEAIYGERHVRTTRASLYLADAIADNGDWDLMETMEKKIVDIRKEILEEDDPETADAMADLARTYRWKGERYREAAELEMEVLRIRRKRLGPKHRQIVEALDDLAATRILQGDFDGAENLRVEALEMITSLVGKAHPATIRIMSRLAKCYKRKGEKAKVIQINRDIIALLRTVRGDRHATTIEAMAKLGRSYSSQNQEQEAEKVWRDVLDIRRKTLGDRHEMTLNALYWLVDSIENQQRWADAEVLWRELMTAERERVGEQHQLTITAMNSLASSLQQQEHYAEAETLYREVVAARREICGKTHQDTLSALYSLTLTIHDQGRYTESEPMWRELLAMTSEKYGDKDLQTLRALTSLTHALYYQDKYTECEVLGKQLVATKKEVLGDDDSETESARNWLAFTIYEQGRYEEAEALWKEVVASESSLGSDHSIIKQAMEQLETVRIKMKAAVEQELPQNEGPNDVSIDGPASPVTLTEEKEELGVDGPASPVAVQSS